MYGAQLAIVALLAQAGTTSVKVVAPTPAVAEVLRQSRPGMGTTVSILIFTADRAGAESAFTAAWAELEAASHALSEWKGTSDIGRINHGAGGTPVTVSVETITVIKAGQEISKAAHGAFSLTWAPLGALWKFSGDELKIPGTDDVAARLPLIGDDKIVIDETAATVWLPTVGMALGLGAIAKGYAVDRALAKLVALGFPDALVVAGGDLAVHGKKGLAPWLVGVQDPGGEGHFATITLKDEAVSTSGDYQQFFERGGKRYHHILNPKTGYPARGVYSVTVVAKDGMHADAYATAVFVLGVRDGMALVEKIDNLEVLIVTDKEEILMSSGLRARVQILRPPTSRAR